MTIKNEMTWNSMGCEDPRFAQSKWIEMTTDELVGLLAVELAAAGYPADRFFFEVYTDEVQVMDTTVPGWGDVDDETGETVGLWMSVQFG